MTSRQVVATMKQLLGDLYQLVGRSEQARAARRAVSQKLGTNPQTVAEWAEWLLDRSAWQAVVDLADLQQERAVENPKLLYAVAEASRQLGRDDAQVEPTLDQAIGPPPPPMTDNIMNVPYFCRTSVDSLNGPNVSTVF